MEGVLGLPLFTSPSPADEKLDLDDGRWEDVHVITGALKLFFRELPEPLFPFSHFRQFISAISELAGERWGGQGSDWAGRDKKRGTLKGSGCVQAAGGWYG